MSRTKRGSRPEPAVTVRIRSARPSFRPGEPIVLRYEIANRAGRDVYLVDDRVFTLYLEDTSATTCAAALTGRTLNHRLAEMPLVAFADMAGYHPPRLRRLSKGRRTRGIAAICLPLRDTIYDAATGPREVEIPVTGEVPVFLSVGYGAPAFEPRPREVGTMTRFLAWQQIADSEPVRVVIH